MLSKVGVHTLAKQAIARHDVSHRHMRRDADLNLRRRLQGDRTLRTTKTQQVTLLVAGVLGIEPFDVPQHVSYANEAIFGLIGDGPSVIRDHEVLNLGAKGPGTLQLARATLKVPDDAAAILLQNGLVECCHHNLPHPYRSCQL